MFAENLQPRPPEGTWWCLSLRAQGPHSFPRRVRGTEAGREGRRHREGGVGGCMLYTSLDV